MSSRLIALSFPPVLGLDGEGDDGLILGGHGRLDGHAGQQLASGVSLAAFGAVLGAELAEPPSGCSRSCLSGLDGR